MKLIIQIPCFNEAASLPVTLPLIPRQVPGFDQVEILVVDDGSTDETAKIAKEHKVDHIVRLITNQGLARAFTYGINTSLGLGADMIVNIDADNQYNASDICKLTLPLLEKRADITIGIRPIENMKNFSRGKKFLQKIGSRFVRSVSKTNVEDATSGFRALTREAALKINIFTKYTYTLEMIMQASEKNIIIKNVPINVNADLRPSRLVKSTFSYLIKSAKTILDSLMIYNAFRFFFTIGLVFLLVGIFAGFRDFWLTCNGKGIGHGPKLILTATLILIGFQLILSAFLARISSVNRRIMEDIQFHLRK